MHERVIHFIKSSTKLVLTPIFDLCAVLGSKHGYIDRKKEML